MGNKLSQAGTVSYKDAGVDIDQADQLVDYIKEARSGKRFPGVLGGIGGFGAFYELPWSDYKQPVLVSGTDGCGTKLRLAIEMGVHDSIGIDLVAMCVNDIITSGAKPLFFLDYYAMGQLRLSDAQAVMRGIIRGCELADMALVGGETAEMPGMYSQDDYDLAGFCVGLVEKSLIIDGRSVQPGDQVIAMGSTGVHANGFSLVRHVCSQKKVSWDEPAWEGATESLGDALLRPTRIYTGAVAALQQCVDVRALAHITGGGIADNLVRVLPDGVAAVLRADSWVLPPIFQRLSELGPISLEQMRATFNCGIGMMAVVPQADVSCALEALDAAGETAWLCGQIEQHTGDATVSWG